MRIVVTLLLMLCAALASGQARQTKKPAPDKPLVLGTIVQLPSAELAETRALNIYLPEGYNPADTTRYPVVYLLDGGTDEDFLHVVGLYQFNSFPWVHRVPPSIIVGIVNVDRRRDLTFPTTIAEDQKRNPTAGKSARFMAFLETELQPYIARRYKTTAAKTLIGESLGGLFATEVLLTKPTLFTQYIIISPSLWWDNESLLARPSALLQEAFTAQTAVYLGVGKEGLAPTTIPHVMEVDVNLLAEKLQATKSKSVRVYFDYLPAENHATIAHQAILNALKLLQAPAK